MSGRVGQLSVTTTPIAGPERRVRLKTMVRMSDVHANNIAKKWAERMAVRARDLAPSSARSLAEGKDSNNPHEVALKDTIVVVRLQNEARYAVDITAPWGVFIVAGTKGHPIVGRAVGAQKSADSFRRMQRTLERKVASRSALLREHIYNKKHRRPDGSIFYTQEEKNLGPRMKRRIKTAKIQTMGWESRIAALENRAHGMEMRALTGKPNLKFPWSKATASRRNGFTAGKFVGPRVYHKLVAPNTFLLRARVSISLGFFNDLQRLLEGRYS